MPEPTAEGLKKWEEVFASPYRWVLSLSAGHSRQCRPYTPDEFSCSCCPHVKDCDGAFAVFNTDGDCLKGKFGSSILRE